MVVACSGDVRVVVKCCQAVCFLHAVHWFNFLLHSRFLLLLVRLWSLLSMGSSASSGSCMHQSILFATKISTNSHVKIPTGLESLNTFEVALHCRSFSRQCITLCKLRRHRPQIEKVGTDGSQRGNQRLPWKGTAGSQTLKLTVPNLGTRGYHCKELPVPRS